MKKTIKSLSLLGAIGALVACNGGTPLRSCSFNELVYSITKEFAVLMTETKLRCSDFHTEYSKTYSEKMDENVGKSIISQISDFSLDEYFFSITTEQKIEATGEEPESVKSTVAYFYDSESGDIIGAEDEKGQKNYFIEISKEGIEEVIKDEERPYDTVEEYLDFEFTQMFVEYSSYALFAGGYVQQIMQSTEVAMISSLPNFLEHDSVKTDGNHYFFDYEETEAVEGDDVVEGTHSIAYHAEFDGMYPITATFGDKEAGKKKDETDPTIIHDMECETVITSLVEFEFKGNKPDLTEYTFVKPE